MGRWFDADTAMDNTDLQEESAEAAIRRRREHSNRSIARRNLLGVGDSLGEDYVGVIGDGTFVASRAEYMRLFKDGFDRPEAEHDIRADS